jgi:hypothetical protein
VHIREIQNNEQSSQWPEKKPMDGEDKAVTLIVPSTIDNLDAEWRTAARALRNAG